MPHRGIFFTVGFKSLRILNRPKKGHPVGCPFLACPKGLEPPFSGIGIRCVIQLRHGQMYAAGYFACRFSFLIRIIFHLKINCKNCCATVFSLYYAVIIQQFFTLSKGKLSLIQTVSHSAILSSSSQISYCSSCCFCKSSSSFESSISFS